MFFGPLLNDFGSILGGSEPQKVGFRCRGVLFLTKSTFSKKSAKKSRFGWKKLSKINQNPSPSASETEVFFDVVFWMIFGRFLMDFGLQKVLKNHQKMDFFAPLGKTWTLVDYFGRRKLFFNQKNVIFLKIMVLPT